MEMIKKLWWLSFPIAYAIIGVIVGIMAASNGASRPILAGLLWFVPVIRALFGGGPL